MTEYFKNKQELKKRLIQILVYFFIYLFLVFFFEQTPLTKYRVIAFFVEIVFLIILFNCLYNLIKYILSKDIILTLKDDLLVIHKRNKDILVNYHDIIAIEYKPSLVFKNKIRHSGNLYIKTTLKKYRIKFVNRANDICRQISSKIK